MPRESLFSLAGQTALITGGTRGIGLAIATEFLHAGARVLVCARSADELDRAVEELTPLGPCEGIVADLVTLDGVNALAVAVGDRVDALHVLVNNAGTQWGAPLEDFPEAGWDKVMDLNVKAVQFLTAALLPLLRAAATPERPARIVNIGSISGIDAPEVDTFSYGASKAAVHLLTRHHARTLAPEITVNAIAPGTFPSKLSRFITDNEAVHDLVTNSIPMGRLGRAEEIGGTAVYLASRAGGYTTGAVLVVDGGRSGAGRVDPLS